ncbi:MAG: CarD family transcriptional regulator [Acidobacteria bacterium]|nr:CarD family transcriptional regulator [Acidobacteriota bacterium]
MGKGATVDFKIGQKVVYPNHGVAIVEQIESRQILGVAQDFYLLRLQANNSVVMVPVHERPSARDWKDRFRGFTTAMRSGNIFAIAEVLKTLTYLNSVKPLSFRERQMMERARYLIVSELAVASKKAENNVGPKVDEAVAAAFPTGC